MTRCGAELYLSDDTYDNICTVICTLPDGHAGDHCATLMHVVGGAKQRVDIVWELDGRSVCCACGVKYGHVSDMLVDDTYSQLRTCSVCHRLFCRKCEPVLFISMAKDCVCNECVECSKQLLAGTLK